MAGAKWVNNLFSNRRATAEESHAGGPVSRRRTSRASAQPRLEALEDRLVPTRLLVITAADSGAGTLRAAITTANQTQGLVTIDFAIGTSGSSQTINLTSALPTISATVLIDGTSQGGSAYSGSPLIELNGARAGGSASGLVLTGNDSTIQGLIIEHFAQDGILLKSNSTGNTVGGTTPGTGNVISGNGNDGIEIVNSGTTNNLVEGNFIGNNSDGTAALANKFDGVLIRAGASGNTIGGTASGASNVIFGNGNDGIEIVNSGTTNNLVEGNFIGTNSDGTAALANKFDGVLIRAGASSNTIGGTGSGAGNVISGDGNDGVEIVNSGTTNNLVQGNFIGSNSGGTAALANKFDGVLIRAGASGNTIGGTASGAGNVISGNGNDGVEIANSGTANNLVQGNFIGTNSGGSAALANKFDGVLIRTGASGNTIGGTASGASNVISGNGNDGIEIVDSGTTNNLVQGNTLGAQSNGVSDLGNGANGIAVRDLAGNNTIGGTGKGAGNIIAFNVGDGVLIGDTRAGILAGARNSIEGNTIFGNHRLGIFLGYDNTAKPPVVLANDSKGHPGVNNGYQNYPVLSTPQVTADSTILAGTLSSPNNPKTTFRIEFFSNSSADPSGYGQGEVFLGVVTVTTNANGQASFSLTLRTPLASGQVISATATDCAWQHV